MKRPVFALTLAVALLTGCATEPWDSDGGGQGHAPQPVEKKEYAGMVESVREIVLDIDRNGVGVIAGAVIGGAAGSSVGRGRGATVGSTVGTVAGAVIGDAVATQVRNQPGLEITVRLDEGSVVAVSQPAGGTFKPGDRVRVVSDGRNARVMR